MSGSHATVVSISAESERRARRGLFEGHGKHRRTPEAWKAMELQRAAERAEVTQMREEKAKSLRLLDQQRRVIADKNRQLEQKDQENQRLLQELHRLQELMGVDKTNPVNQQTHSYTMPERPVDHSDPVQVATQPISVIELLADEPPTRVDISKVRPAPKVYPFPTPEGVPPMPSYSPTPPAAKPPHPNGQGLHAVDNSENVKSTTVPKLVALWEAPFALGADGAKKTA
jgi:hypothetical protein